MANNRIYYAIQAVGLKADGDTGAFDNTDLLHGVQQVGMSANFSLTPVYELGKLKLYENIEGIPELEVTVGKVLDGYPLIYHQATKGTTTTSPTLVGRSKSTSILGLAICDESKEYVDGSPSSIAQASGLYVSSVAYNFPLEDNFNESVTLVGNDRVWLNTPDYGETLGSLVTPAFTGVMSATDAPLGQGGVNRRENLLFDFTGSTVDTNGAIADKDATILPFDVYGISESGTNNSTAGVRGAHVTNISVSANLGRDPMYELGKFTPYCRNLVYPVEVTCDIEVTSHSGDLVSFTENGIFTTGTACGDKLGNLQNRTIRIATCEGTRIYLGMSNKLSSVNYGGGDAGGGNVTVTYSYSTFNDFTVVHSGDPHASGSTWWTNRATYLLN